MGGSVPAERDEQELQGILTTYRDSVGRMKDASSALSRGEAGPTTKHTPAVGH